MSEDDKPIISKRELEHAVTLSCSCGGGGPDDQHTCPACLVYHRLIALKLKQKEAGDGH